MSRAGAVCLQVNVCTGSQRLTLDMFLYQISFVEIGSPSPRLESTDSAGMAVNELWEPDCLKPSEPELWVSSKTPGFSVGFEDSDLHPCTLYAQNHLPSAQSTFLNGENRRPLCFSCYIHTCREMGASI